MSTEVGLPCFGPGERIPVWRLLNIKIFENDTCFCRGQGEKQDKWKHLPIVDDIHDSATTWTWALGVQHKIIGTKRGIIQLEARDTGDQGALHILG